MAVHARAIDAVERLGHKGGVQSVALGNRLERHPERYGVVRGLKSGAVLEVDLVLADRDLVMAGLHHDPLLLEGVDHLLADIGRQVGGHVEIASLIVRQRLNTRGSIGPQQEEL